MLRSEERKKGGNENKVWGLKVRLDLKLLALGKRGTDGMHKERRGDEGRLARYCLD